MYLVRLMTECSLWLSVNCWAWGTGRLWWRLKMALTSPSPWRIRSTCTYKACSRFGVHWHKVFEHNWPPIALRSDRDSLGVKATLCFVLFTAIILWRYTCMHITFPSRTQALLMTRRCVWLSSATAEPITNSTVSYCCMVSCQGQLTCYAELVLK